MYTYRAVGKSENLGRKEQVSKGDFTREFPKIKNKF